MMGLDESIHFDTMRFYGSRQDHANRIRSWRRHGRNETMGRNEKTSKRVGKTASTLLRSKKSSKAVKSVAGSALTQRPDRKKRGKKK